MWVYLWALYLVPLVYISVFCTSTILSWLLQLCSIVWSQEGWFLPVSFFFLKIALAIWGLWYFHTNCKISFLNSVKTVIDNLQELYWICSFLWVVWLFSQYWFFQSKNMVYLSIGRFIPRYFILFDSMANEIVSLISLSDLSVSVYRDEKNFCVFILCPDTLQIHWGALVVFGSVFRASYV